MRKICQSHLQNIPRALPFSSSLQASCQLNINYYYHCHLGLDSSLLIACFHSCSSNPSDHSSKRDLLNTLNGSYLSGLKTLLHLPVTLRIKSSSTRPSGNWSKLLLTGAHPVGIVGEARFQLPTTRLESKVHCSPGEAWVRTSGPLLTICAVQLWASDLPSLCFGSLTCKAVHLIGLLEK